MTPHPSQNHFSVPQPERLEIRRALPKIYIYRSRIARAARITVLFGNSKFETEIRNQILFYEL